MKLTPLGKKLKFYMLMVFVSIIGIGLSFYFVWIPVFWVLVICLIWSAAQVISIGMDANLHKYNYKGQRHGSDLLVEYEPEDAEYEREKGWQDENEPIVVNVDVEVKTKE